MNTARSFLVILAGIILVVLAGWVALKTQERKQECLDSGGWINEYNCGESGCLNWSCIHDR